MTVRVVDRSPVHISARSDYAVQAMLAIAAGPGGGAPVRASALAGEQKIPFSFLQGILVDLKHAGLLVSRRGVHGGYALARHPSEISVGDVLRAVGGAPGRAGRCGPAGAVLRDGSAGATDR